MENATKALLIAAAVLVAILIISLGLVVYNMAAETVNNSANLSEYEIQSFNEKFTKYLGDNVSGTTVNAMINTVFNHNLAQEQDNAAKKVTVIVKSTSLSGTVIDREAENPKSPDKVDTGRRYTVEADYNPTSRLIETINVSEN